MPSLKEIKGRIASVGSTLKITSAMKMVAAAKLHKAQKALGTLLPYQQELNRMLRALVGEGGISVIPSEAKEAPRSVALVCFSSNASLCGGFNAAVIRKALEAVRENLAAGAEVCVYSVGRKMADTMRREGLPSPHDYTELSAHPSYEGAAALGTELLEGFRAGRFARVELIYNHYKSTASQPTLREVLLPMTAPTEADSFVGLRPPQNDREVTPDPSPFIIEPDRDSAIRRLLPQVLLLRLYATLLDSAAAEHAARTVAMQMATDNAEDLLAELTRAYNKSRQQKITAEILDLEGGAVE